MTGGWYDLEHQPIDFVAGAHLLADVEARRVAYDDLGNAVVSTVFLVQDHDHSGSGVPVLYETKVDTLDTQLFDRYHTRIEALAGHDQWVSWARDHAPQPRVPDDASGLGRARSVD